MRSLRSVISRKSGGAGNCGVKKLQLARDFRAFRGRGVGQPAACFVLPTILACMRQTLPDVVVDLLVSNSVSNLLMREADMALRMVRPEQRSMVAKHIGQVALRACAS